MVQDIALAITGLGALIAALAGVLLVVHSVRGKERKASDEEITELSRMLDEARASEIRAKRRQHEYDVWLAEQGLEPPP